MAMKKIFFAIISFCTLNLETIHASQQNSSWLRTRQQNYEVFENIESYKAFLLQRNVNSPNYLLALATVDHVIDETICKLATKRYKQLKNNRKSNKVSSPFGRSFNIFFETTSDLNEASIQNKFKELETEAIMKQLLNNTGQQASEEFKIKHQEIANEKLDFDGICKKNVDRRSHILEQVKILLREEAKESRYAKKDTKLTELVA